MDDGRTDECFQEWEFSRHHAPQFESPLFSTVGAVLPGQGLAGLASGGVPPHHSRAVPRKASDKGPVCLQALMSPPASSVPFDGLLSPSGCYALTFSPLAKSLREELEGCSP